MTHRSRLCHFVIDVDDLDQGLAFWSAALDAKEEPLSEASYRVYRRLRLPDSDIRILLQRTDDLKTVKEPMHLDLETDDIEAEVQRLEALGATRWDHQQERGYDFWVLRDPWGNEFCVLEPNFPELLDRRAPWPDEDGPRLTPSRLRTSGRTRPQASRQDRRRVAVMPEIYAPRRTCRHSPDGGSRDSSRRKRPTDRRST